MTTFNIARWFVVALAVVGLAIAAPVASAHGTDSTVGDAPPAGGTATEWTAWMEAQMTQHMGPGTIEWMESHMGVTIEEMGQFMAGGNHRGPGMTARGGMTGSGGMYGGGMAGSGGMYGAGQGC
ncbi:hypothetical protein [Haloferax sp. DFSO52]|uniref:hypothetical protein n=1 Tax=Haloferax sp. DFSO52 TaxID=3388505 RepID=UPI003A8B6C30